MNLILFFYQGVVSVDKRGVFPLSICFVVNNLNSASTKVYCELARNFHQVIPQLIISASAGVFSGVCECVCCGWGEGGGE